MNDIRDKIRKINIPEIVYKKIEPTNLSENFIRRYFIRRYDGKIAEVNTSDFAIYRDSPFFEKLIMNWYIRGSREFVRSKNETEISIANGTFNGISALLVNPLQFYQSDG